MINLRPATLFSLTFLALACGDAKSSLKPEASHDAGSRDAGHSPSGGDGDQNATPDAGHHGQAGDGDAHGDGDHVQRDAGSKSDASMPSAKPGTLGQACKTNQDCEPQFTCGFDVNFDNIPAPNGHHSACVAACTGDAECNATAMESDTVCLVDPGSPCVKSCLTNYDACPEGTFCNERSFCEVIERTGIDFDPKKGTLGSPCEKDTDCNSQFTCGFDVSFEGIPGPNGHHSACVAPCTGDANCTATARESDTICLSDPGEPCVKGCGKHPEVCPQGTFCNEREFCERSDRRMP